MDYLSENPEPEDSNKGSYVGRAWNSTLARRLIAQTIIFSSAITFLITIAQLYYEYRVDLNALDSAVLEIERSRTQGIAESLWVVDEKQMVIQLKGIVGTEEIKSARVFDERGEVWAEGVGRGSVDTAREHDIPLKIERHDEWKEIGTLKIVPDLNAVYEKLINKAIVSIVSNGVKTFLVVVFFVSLFYMKVGRHLAVLAEQAKAHQPGMENVSFSLSRISSPSGDQDELEVLTTAMNKMVEDCERHRQRHADLEKEAVESRDALFRANMELEEFTHRASHDLRAPIVSALSLLQLAQQFRESDKQEELQHCLTVTEQSLTTLRELIDSVIEIAVLKNKEELEEPVDVSAVVDQCVALLAHLPGAEQVELIRELEFKEAIITKDSRLRNIVENLLSNAIKYHDPGEQKPTVWIRTKEENGNFVLSIADNGLGIPKEHEEDLFKMFKRFHTRVSFGSGLGMHLMQTSAASIGGVLRYERQPKGCKFVLEIPLAEVRSQS